jgi:uncharacterized protein (DUF885 family)
LTRSGFEYISPSIFDRVNIVAILARPPEEHLDDLRVLHAYGHGLDHLDDSFERLPDILFGESRERRHERAQHWRGLLLDEVWSMVVLDVLMDAREGAESGVMHADVVLLQGRQQVSDFQGFLRD